MADTTIDSTPSATLVTGAAGAGKTTLIMQEVGKLVAQGASADSICVIAATPGHALELALALIAAHVDVACAWALEAKAAGADPASTDPAIPAKGLQAVREHKSARKEVAFDHIIVDDYQLLSRESQAFVNAIANESIWISANPDNRVRAFEPEPNFAGADEFLQANPDAEKVELKTSFHSKAVVEAGNKLSAAQSLGVAAIQTGEYPEDGYAEVKAVPDEAAEVETVVAAVKRAQADYIDQERIIVTAPSTDRIAAIEDALAAADISHTSEVPAPESNTDVYEKRGTGVRVYLPNDAIAAQADVVIVSGCTDANFPADEEHARLLYALVNLPRQGIVLTAAGEAGTLAQTIA